MARSRAGVQRIIDQSADAASVVVPDVDDSTIVVVDDDPDARGLLRELLERRGYRAVALASGDECLAYLRGDEADLVITDLMMPGISGIELCRELRARHPELRAIVLTALADHERANAAISAGACDVLRKPITTDLLDVVIRRALAVQP
jgi:CheY-like chemotaxis protein